MANDEYNVDPRILQRQIAEDLKSYFPHFSPDNREGECTEDSLLNEYQDLLTESMGNREQATQLLKELQAREDELKYHANIKEGRVSATNEGRLRLYTKK